MPVHPLYRVNVRLTIANNRIPPYFPAMFGGTNNTPPILSCPLHVSTPIELKDRRYNRLQQVREVGRQRGMGVNVRLEENTKQNR